MIVLIFIIALLIDQTMVLDIYRNDQWEPPIICRTIADAGGYTIVMETALNRFHVMLDCDTIFSDGFEP